MTPSIEERLTTLEEEVAELNRLLDLLTAQLSQDFYDDLGDAYAIPDARLPC